MLFQCTRNAHTIAKALMYNHTRTGKMADKENPANFVILEPIEPTLVQKIMHAHIHNPSITPPTDNSSSHTM